MSTDRLPLPAGQLRVVLGVSRARVLPLRLAYEADEQVRVVGSCTTASEVLAALERGEADGAILDEDLHGLDRARLEALKERQWRVVLLSRQPESARWDGSPGAVLHVESDPIDILHALRRAAPGQSFQHRRPSQTPARPARQSPTTAKGEQPAASLPGAAPASKSRVIGFWGGRGGAGKTTLALNSLALGGAVEPTVLVELETTAASLAAYLDDGRDGRPRRARGTLLELAGAQLRTSDDWEMTLAQILQPLGSYSPQARLLCGIAHPEQRSKLANPVAFVEALVGALRLRFARVLLDIGSDPLGGESTEALIASTSLRLADQVLVVATPDRPSVHRTCMAVGEAGHRLDRQGVGLVINRVDPKLHGDVSWISDAVGLPIVATLPADDRAQRRAIAAAEPVVRDPDSRLRRPLGELLEQIGSPRSLDAFAVAPRLPRRLFSSSNSKIPMWGRLRTALTFVLSVLGGPR
jgi:MinD-like ATPase involved in chromosome partitioning or flagellar assembly